MDRNSILGIVLIVAILFGFTWYNMPNAEERARLQHVADSTAQAEQELRAKTVNAEELAKQQALDSAAGTRTTDTTTIDPLIAAADSALADSLQKSALARRFSMFEPAAQGVGEELVIANNRLQVSINTHGARPTLMLLKKYQTYRKKPLILADPDSGRYDLTFRVGNLDISTQDLYFTVEKKDSNAVVLRAATSDPAKFLRVSYALDSTSYFMHTKAEFVKMAEEVDARNFAFHWDLVGLNNEKYKPAEEQKCGVYFKYFNDKRSYIGETAAEEKKLEGKTNWVAFKQDFFTVAMVSEEGFASNGSEIAVAPIADSAFTKSYKTTLYFEKDRGAAPTVDMRFYLGPNHYGTLKETEIPDFEKIIDLGWGIFGWMNQWLVIPIFNWLDAWGWNYGIIILVLTVVIKLLLMPLTYKNLVSSAKMRALKPEIDVI
ncbi:MAG TPA: membrane protein insertase YidC, partial [Flavobacteriales bacterium]|nr:membrane protein insertase YidC [Flavobacteriales bacterium]